MSSQANSLKTKHLNNQVPYIPLALATIIGLVLVLFAVNIIPRMLSKESVDDFVRRISLAVIEYEQAYDALPPPITFGPSGEIRYSWKVQILEFIDENELAKNFDHNSEWNSKSNSRFRQTPESLIHVSPDGTRLTVANIVNPKLPNQLCSLDKKNYPIMLVLVPDNYEWAKPNGVTFEQWESFWKRGPTCVAPHDLSVFCGTVDELKRKHPVSFLHE